MRARNMKDDKRLKRKVRNSYIVSTVSITLVLFLLGSVGYLMTAAMKIADTLQESISVSVELRKELTPEERQAVEQQLEAEQIVSTISFVPKEEKLACYRRLYKMYNKLDTENRYLTIRTHLSHCCNMLRHCWKPDDIRLALMYVYPAYEEYRNIVQPEFLRDDRDIKVARRSPWVFRFRNGVWIWIASKIINI